MKKYLPILTAMLYSLVSMTQNTDATLFGDIKAEEGGKHPSHAIIQVEGTNLRTQCDASGYFKLSNLPIEKQVIIATLVDYQQQEEEVGMINDKGSEAHSEPEGGPLELDQAVITGTRTSHFIKDAPIRVEVLTSQAITRKSTQNLYKAPEGVPGIRVEQRCQSCNLSEVRMQGLGAEHAQVFIDDEPIYSGLAGVHGLQQIGTNDIDRLEMVKGVSSALYRSGAVAGTINIISKGPTFESSINGDIQFGNFGFKSYKDSGSVRYNNIGLSVFAQRTQMDAIGRTQNGLIRKEVKNKDGISDHVGETMNNLGFNLYFCQPFAKNNKLVLRDKAIDKHRFGGVMANDQHLNPYIDGTEDIHTNRLSADPTCILPIGRHSELNLTTAYVYHKHQAANDTFLYGYMDSHKGPAHSGQDGAEPDVSMMRPYIAKGSTMTPSLTFTSVLGNHALLGGVQGYFTRLRETGLYVISAEDRETGPYYGIPYTSIGKKHVDEPGFFVQDEWSITPRLTVAPSIRIDSHSFGEEYAASVKVSDSAFPTTKFSKATVNPRITIKYELTPSLVLRANVGTGFRAPYGFSENPHPCSGSPRVQKSSNLRGKRVISYNLSADYYAKKYQFSINTFRTNLRDKIQLFPADDEVKKFSYPYQWKNVDDTYVQDVKLSAKASLFHNFDAGVNWTLNQGKFKHERVDWSDPNDETVEEFPQRLQYAKGSRNISRFPVVTSDINLDYTPGTWTFSLTNSSQGRVYIDYNSEDNGATSKIKKTNTFTIFNCRAAERFGTCTVYAGAKSIFSYIRDKKHTSDTAFMYTPVYGATWYAGPSVKL